MVVLPYSVLGLRMRSARQRNDRRELFVARAEDHREHLLVYLFAMLLPFYTASLDSWRDFTAEVAALAFVVFLFWHLNLHYMNLLFALAGYRVFTVYPPSDDNPFSGRETFVLITRRLTLAAGQTLAAYRLSDTVYFESSE
jgi:hypothetical protein